MYDDYYATAHQLVQQGVPFVSAIVVRAEKPTSAKPGDKAIITADGVMHGWIGGSCAQPTVIQEALQVLTQDEACLVRLSLEEGQEPERAGVVNRPMTCFSGGTLEIYLEPQHPRPRLLIVGSLPVARALAHLGQAMNYHVLAVDLDQGAGLPHADELLSSLDGIGEQIRPHTYIVVASHGNYDEHALEQILPHKPTYVGLVASPKRAAAVREYLKLRGFSQTDMLALKAPAGLDIQARRGDEIALSIMAEIVQRRRNAEELDLALLHESLVSSSAASGAEVAEVETADSGQSAVAIDPICGMEVTIEGARYTHEYEGKTYYFCCAGCQMKFAQEPQQYAAV
jgi:xanthine dehydrogenase accessory factor